MKSLAKIASVVERQRLVEQSARKQEECKKEADGAFESAVKDQAEYDKQLLSLSAGLLAISLAFVKDVVHLDDAIYQWLLYLSFVLSSSCIVVVLFSYQLSIAVNEKLRSYWLREGISWELQNQSDEENVFPEVLSKRVKWTNYGSGTLFALSVMILVTFITTNMVHQADMTSKQPTLHASQAPKPPAPNTAPGAGIKVPPTKPPKSSKER